MEELKKPKLDELDVAILGHLAADGRRPFTEIAAELGVSHGTVRNRYNRMVSSLSLKIVSLLDPSRMGFRAGAQIRLIVEPPQLAATTGILSAFPEITWLGELLGEFNVICDVWCWDLVHLDEFVSRNLRQLAAVRQMEMALYSRIHKVGSTASAELAHPGAGGGIGAGGQTGPLPTSNRPPAPAGHSQSLDGLDIAILKILGEDARTPFAEISEALSVSRATVRKRYNGWCATGSLKTSWWFGRKWMGQLAGAHVDLSIEPRRLEEALAVLVSYPEVAWTAEMLGEFNLMADVLSTDLDHVQQFVRDRIRDLPGLRHLEVGVYSDVQKMVTTQNLELLERTAPKG